jgi:hypothetical protein
VLVHDLSLQYLGFGWRLYLSQWFNHEPHLHEYEEVPLMFFTVAILDFFRQLKNQNRPQRTNYQNKDVTKSCKARK